MGIEGRVTAVADVGVFGGSGFYSFLDEVREVTIETSWGVPSAPVTLGFVGDVRVAFLPRHGVRHHLPPHRVDYRANVAAMQSARGPCAARALRRGFAPTHDPSG